MSTPTISAAQVKELRDRTGAGMMDCKKALEETDGDIDAAVELLRVRLGDKALQDRRPRGHRGHRRSPTSTPTARSACSSRSTATPTSSPATTTSSRSRATSRCTSPPRRRRSTSPRTRSREDAKEAELRVFEQQAADKPENVRAQDRRGQAAQVDGGGRAAQPGARQRDKYDGKTIEQLRAELSGTTGENVVIRRFARFAVGA